MFINLKNHQNQKTKNDQNNFEKGQKRPFVF